jgi:hypothetical protein
MMIHRFWNLPLCISVFPMLESPNQHKKVLERFHRIQSTDVLYSLVKDVVRELFWNCNLQELVYQPVPRHGLVRNS